MNLSEELDQVEIPPTGSSVNLFKQNEKCFQGPQLGRQLLKVIFAHRCILQMGTEKMPAAGENFWGILRYY